MVLQNHFIAQNPAEFIRRLLNDACKGNNIYYAIFSMGFGMTQGKSKR